MQTFRGAGDDVDESDTIVCVSDHEDAGQNEPYAQEPGGEVSAKNRPTITPKIAALGVSAIGPLNTYRVGFGYAVEDWYDEYRIVDLPPFLMDWTDPQAAGDNPDGSNTPSHLLIKHRIAGPVFDASSSGPGVMRVNDIDVAGEAFDDPHYERSNYGQTEVFNVAGDPQSWCLGDNCTPAPGGSRLLTFTTQGDLPISWSLKASLATASKLRTITLDAAFLDQWHESWANWCAHLGREADVAGGAWDERAVHAWRGPGPGPDGGAGTGRPGPLERTPWSSGRSSSRCRPPRPASSRHRRRPRRPRAQPRRQKAKYSRCVKAASKKKGKARTRGPREVRTDAPLSL